MLSRQMHITAMVPYAFVTPARTSLRSHSHGYVDPVLVLLQKAAATSVSLAENSEVSAVT